MLTRPPEERFWPKVRKGEADECWPWMSATFRSGYGHFTLGGRRGWHVSAHRFAYELTHGPIPAGLHVCHTCDNPPCCNPAHLFLGTRSDNMVDARDKGRLRPPAASRALNGHAKLSEEDVVEVRALLGGLTQKAIATRFGVSRSAIGEIARGATWC